MALTWFIAKPKRAFIMSGAVMLTPFLLLPFIGRDFFPDVDAGRCNCTSERNRAHDWKKRRKSSRMWNMPFAGLPRANELDLVLDNVGVLPDSFNLAFSDGATIGSFDGEILMALKEKHHPVRDYVRSLRETLPKQFPGVSLNIPLGNRTARADAARDQLQVRQQEIRLWQLQKEVRLQVLNAMIALQQARETYGAAVKERTYEQQTVEAESERLGVGASTTYQVIQYQRDLTSARSAEISALSSYVEAKAALERAVGATLQDNQVTLDEARTGTAQRTGTPETAK